MDLLLILIYSVFCIVIFKVFKVFLNKWIVFIVILGGIVLIGGLFILMNYNYFYVGKVCKYLFLILIILMVWGCVFEVNVVFNQMMQVGDILFKLDLILFQGKVDLFIVQEVVVKVDLEWVEILVKFGFISQWDCDIVCVCYDDV